MAHDKKSRPKKGMATVIPTVCIPAGKAKPKKASKIKSHKSAKPKVRTDAPPVNMAPPEMKDSRPTRPAEVPKPIISEDVQRQVNEAVDQAQSAPDPEPAPAPSPVNGKPAEVSPPRTPAPSADPRPVMGSSCTWIGTMGEAPDNQNGNPSCPYCGGGLLTRSDEATTKLGFEAYERGMYTSIKPEPRAHPGYVGLMEWLRGQQRCWVTIEEAAVEYEAATGKHVDPAR